MFKKEDSIEDLFKYVTDCPGKNFPPIINYVMPRLVHGITHFNYANSEDLNRQLTLSTWINLSVLTMAEIDSQASNYEHFIKEALKKRIENDCKNLLNVLNFHYKSKDVFILDCLAFFTSVGLWHNKKACLNLLPIILHKTILFEELVIHLCKIISDEYNMKNENKVKNIINIISNLMLYKEWETTSLGAYTCLESILRVYENIYQEHDKNNSIFIEELLKWMNYFVKRLNQHVHILETIDTFSVWLYFYAQNVDQVVNLGSLIFTCCYMYYPYFITVSLKHFFQDIILCMINSNELNIVSLGYDILICLTDRFGNRGLLENPIIFNEEVVMQLKMRDRRMSFIYENLFSFEEFVSMMDSIQKVVLNSIKRFISNKIVARKVNTLISLLVLEGFNTAQGLVTTISIALTIQDFIFGITRTKPQSDTPDTINNLNPHAVYYHGCIASWFSLLSCVNAGDLNLFRSYVNTVIDLRADSAPYLLPSPDPVPLFKYYIYEMDKSLYFDIDEILGAIENSWAVLTNNKELLNNIKIPRATVLIEKFVDLKLLDTFDTYKVDHMKSQTDREDLNMGASSSVPDDDVSADETKTLFTDIENIRFSTAFTEPFERFVFPNISESNSML